VHWKGATFKEYIQEELVCYSAGMTTNMKRSFKFVNISRNTYYDVTTRCLEEDYSINFAVRRPVSTTCYISRYVFLCSQKDARCFTTGNTLG
jgi:hypothetical protein